MKKRHHGVIALIVVAAIAAAVLGAYGVDRYVHRPEPEPTITRTSFDTYRNQVFQEQQQAEAVHKQQMAAAVGQISTVTKKQTAVCDFIKQRRLTHEACK